MRRARRGVHRVIHHPGCQLVAGLVLLASAIAELRGRYSGAASWKWGCHGAYSPCGTYHVLAGLAPFVEALSKSDEAIERLRHEREDKPSAGSDSGRA